MIDTQLSKGTLFNFLNTAKKADQEDTLWQLYLHSFSEKSFDDWKEEVRVSGR